MTFYSHHAILVTSSEELRIRRAHVEVLAALSTKGLLLPVSEVLSSPVNSFYSFFVGPDGSKETWPNSEQGDQMRDEIIEILANAGVRWCEVQYADENDNNHVTRTDATYNAELGDKELRELYARRAPGA